VNQILEQLRRLLLALLAVGLIGTAADLLLLDHYENATQVLPLVLVAVALLVVGWFAWTRAALALAIMRGTMAMCIAAGALGIVLHYQSNREFQKEVDPSLEGWPLVVKVVRAKAPPALAPASMIQLGLLGLLCTYRYPNMTAASSVKGEHR
jgi:hypothetical protein